MPSLRFALYMICLPSGLQIGVQCNDGSNVSRVGGNPGATSRIQISVCRPSGSVWSPTTRCPSDERRTLLYIPGTPTVPAAFPLRSNQVNCERAAPFPVCVTRTSPLDTLKTALPTREAYSTSSLKECG